MDAGTLFTTYSLLCRPSRLEQLQVWCGGAFDGVIALDEVHKAKSATAPEDSSAFTKSARALLSLQECWPDARMLYVSATQAPIMSCCSVSSRGCTCGAAIRPFPHLITLPRPWEAGKALPSYWRWISKPEGSIKAGISRLLASSCSRRERTL